MSLGIVIFLLRKMKTALVVFLVWFLFVPFSARTQTEFLGNEEEQPQQPEQPPPEQPPPVAEPQQPAVQEVALPPLIQNPIDVLLLMDVSGSMEALILDENMNKFNAAKQALSNVVQNMSPSVRFQLWTFSGSVKQHPIPMGKDKQKKRGKFEPIGGQDSQARKALLDLVRSLEIPRDANVTNLYLALRQAMQYYHSSGYNLPNAGNPPSKVIVVLSDGKDDQQSPVRLGDILIAKANFPEIEIKTLGFGIQPDDPFHKELCSLATKAQCALAQDAQQLQKVLKSFTTL